MLATFTEQAKQALETIRAEQSAANESCDENKHIPQDKMLEEQNYPFYLNKDQLIRFLRARDYDIPKTTQMYVNWVKWRLDYRADRIDPEQIRAMLEKETIKIVGHSIDNSLVVLVQARYHEPTAQHIDDLVRYGIFVTEQAIQRLEREGRKPCIHVIYDRTGMTNANRDYALIKLSYKMIGMLQDFYCERLGNFYVLGANWVYWAAFKLIKAFLAKKTRDKIHIINSNE